MEGGWIWERKEVGEGLVREERGELWLRCNILEKNKEKEKRRKEIMVYVFVLCLWEI